MLSLPSLRAHAPSDVFRIRRFHIRVYVHTYMCVYSTYVVVVAVVVVAVVVVNSIAVCISPSHKKSITEVLALPASSRASQGVAVERDAAERILMFGNECRNFNFPFWLSGLHVVEPGRLRIKHPQAWDL